MVDDRALGALDDVILSARTLFPDLEFLAPGGVLELAVRRHGVERIRVELPPGQFLHLQGIGVDAPDDGRTARARVEVSSWYKSYGERFELQRLLDFEHPTGTVVHTGADEPAWLELVFDSPIDIERLRLRNVDGPTAVRARGLRVLLQTGGTWLVAYDHAARAGELRRLLTHRTELGGDPTITALLPLLAQTFEGAYADARQALDAHTEISTADRSAFRAAVTSGLLADRELEWTVHGPQRCFRFWDETEKVTYVEFAAKVAEALASLTPQVCFGFGAALCVVRDGDLIPHDDDLDIIIGFDPHEAGTLGEGLALVEQCLRPLGYTVTGNFTAHRQVRRNGSKQVDVFVGLFEGDTISWYPGTRGALDRDLMFPASEGRLLGVPVPLPRNPLVYLERLYGEGWRHPDPNFKHTWDRATYADLTRPGRG
ncbi:hypothetical protein [Phycicoccus sp. Soil748]|uniref:hypothetical protein n=1 Tax=Phycicoccus sp. Soil748 TaxID=1736397 RepID=UPI00070353C7|nr:hypothetical protein [Phycicoccus sp. Soil748]KRE55360.1 hypothetical protein ASG70_08245 [Phycicoccus sp. Soil748]